MQVLAISVDHLLHSSPFFVDRPAEIGRLEAALSELPKGSSAWSANKEELELRQELYWRFLRLTRLSMLREKGVQVGFSPNPSATHWPTKAA